MSDTLTERRRSRLLHTLQKLGFTSVQQAAASLDADVPLTALKGVGEVLSEVMREWLEEIRASGV